MPLPAALRDGVIDVWPVWLDACGGEDVGLRRLLSPEETARANRFVTSELRRAYELGRGTLRLLLASYLERNPHELVIAIGPHGKPALPASRIQFNLSHSHGLAVYAFTLDREIGVDVEKLRILPDLDLVARHGLGLSEVAPLLAIADARDREAHFFRRWTRKEACAKAAGGGLTGPPPQDDLTVHEFHPAAGFTAALAYGDAARPVTLHPLTSAGELLATFRGLLV